MPLTTADRPAIHELLSLHGPLADDRRHHGPAQLLTARLEAPTAFVNGDVGPLLAISAGSPASIFGPSGTTVIGSEEVNEVNAAGAKHFGPGATNSFDVAHSHADGDLAYWTGVQRSVLHPVGADEPMAMDLRVTEIFRREDGAWKLLHRHADQLGGQG